MKWAGPTIMVILWCAAFWLNGYGVALSEGSRRGINVDPNRPIYHMMIVIDRHPYMLHDITEAECEKAKLALKRHEPEAWVCCYGTAEQARAC